MSSSPIMVGMESEPVPSSAFLELASLSTAELGKKMQSGHKPDRSRLSGFEYRGLNTAGWIRGAGADRFVKGFAADQGYNRRVPRGARTDPWLPTEEPEPERFAYFALTDVDGASRDNRYLDSLLLDYGRFAKSRLDPAGRLRDYLVALDLEHTLLLGHAFFAFGRLRVPATFFLLERLRPAP